MKTIRWFTTQQYNGLDGMRNSLKGQSVELSEAATNQLINELNDKFHNVVFDVTFDDNGHITQIVLIPN
jgi:hypothetical protein